MGGPFIRFVVRPYIGTLDAVGPSTPTEILTSLMPTNIGPSPRHNNNVGPTALTRHPSPPSGQNLKQIPDHPEGGRSPLRLSAYLGFAVSLFAFVYAIKIIGSTILFGNPVKGYPSLIVMVLLLGGIQLMALGVIGEYLGRLYEESKQRPIYVVRMILGPSDSASELKQ